MTRAQLTGLREQRAGVLRAMQAIATKAEDEGRELSAAERRVYKKHEVEFDGLTAKITSGEANLDDPRGPMDERTRRVVTGRDGSYSADGTFRAGHPDEIDTRVPVLGREQRVADWAAARPSRSGFTVEDGQDFCLGNIMLAKGNPAFRAELTDVEQRALAEGTDATGGFITPEPLSAQIIDKIRNHARVVEAGAQTVPLDSDKQSIPRLSGDPTGAWRNEGAAFAESQHAFERVTFTPQSYGFIVKTSEELYQDMVPGGGTIIEHAIVQTAALELDRVALRGSGTAPEPRGVRNQAAVTIQSMGVNGAVLGNYAPAMTALTTLLTANREPTGMMLAPRTSQYLAGLSDTTNQPLNPPQPVADLRRFVTSQIPVNLTQGTSNDTSEVYVADWRDLLIGIRLGIQLRLLTERYADNGQFAWRVFLRADIQLAHPESFVVITGVRP